MWKIITPLVCHKLLILLALLVIAFIYQYKIATVPPLLNQDEASFANEANCIAKTLHDCDGNFLPVYFETLEPTTTDIKNPVLIYLTAIFIRIIGFSTYSTRSVSLIAAMISIILIYAISRELFPKNFHLHIASMLIIATTPLFVISARVVNDPIMLMPFLFTILYCLLLFQRNPKLKYVLLSAFFAGVGFYSYSPGRVFSPLFFVVCAVFLFYKKIKMSSYIGLLLIGIGVMLLIISPAFYVHTHQIPGVLTSRLEKPFVDIITHDLRQYLYKYVNYFNPLFLFWFGDASDFHSTRRSGVFLIVTLPLTIVGIFHVIRRNRRLSYILLSLLLVYPILAALLEESYRASRAINIIPVISILAIYGFDYVLACKNKIIPVIITFFLISQSILFFRDYYFYYEKRVENSTTYNRQLVYALRSINGFYDPVFLDTRISFIHDYYRYLRALSYIRRDAIITEPVNVPIGINVWFMTKRELEPAITGQVYEVPVSQSNYIFIRVDGRL